jgi:hypothetical protein
MEGDGGLTAFTHPKEKRRQGSDAGLEAALRWGIDHEESRAAAAPVSGIHSGTRREAGTTRGLTLVLFLF